MRADRNVHPPPARVLTAKPSIKIPQIRSVVYWVSTRRCSQKPISSPECFDGQRIHGPRRGLHSEETTIEMQIQVAQVGLMGISKRYGRDAFAVDSVDLAVQPGEFFTLLGPSGSGKTTLLRLISGLEYPDAGVVQLAGTNVNPLPPRDRDVAMVFQTPALYPYLSVFGNLAFPLRTQKVAKPEIRTRVEGVAMALGLGALLDRKPQALSGGERQRVALGRAIVKRPSVYLLDEPFSSLDAPLRASLRASLMAFHRSSNATMILVTHDQGEALALSDRIGVMNAGELVEVGTPRSLYERPMTRFVAGFLGNPPMNLMVQALDVDGPVILGPLNRPTVLDFPVPTMSLASDRQGVRVELGVRPEDIVLLSPEQAVPEKLVTLIQPAITHRVEYLGNEVVVHANTGPNMIRVRLDASMVAPSPGEARVVGFALAKAHWFDRDTGNRIESS